MSLLFWLAVICLVLTLAVSLEIALGMKHMTRIDAIAPLGGDKFPRVSVIIPACNEAATVEPALTSIIGLDYSNLEIIVVNDRSTDSTGDVLRRMQKQFPSLQILHNTDLPPGWLGKSHALQLGAKQATGEYLLFTDADIHMEKTVLSRAMHHMDTNRLDHISMFFENTAPGGLLNSLFLEVGGGLLLLYKPWKARNPKSKRFMGVGAFNLMKASVYKQIGGHEKVAMHPIDDIMLGKVIKRQGFQQDCLLGNGYVSVQWYKSIKEFISGIMKNTFAVYNYSVTRIFAGILFLFLINILPFWAFFFTDGLTRILFAAAILIRILSFAKGFADAGINPWYAGWSLITPYINIYIALKATLITLGNQGIDWRGTHYPLEKLKEGLHLTKLPTGNNFGEPSEKTNFSDGHS